MKTLYRTLFVLAFMALFLAGIHILQGNVMFAWIALLLHSSLAYLCGFFSGYMNSLKDSWNLITEKIPRGHLPGNGFDKVAERNGVILAANLLAEKIKEEL